MADNSENYAIETRSRSRSKTPSKTVKEVQRAKTPNVQTILEESAENTPSRTSKRLKEARVVVTSISESVITSTAKKESRKTVNTKETKETSQNETNLLLETSIEAIKRSMVSPNGNTSDNAAYKVYKEAGEYWNKTPKTDYTYSELSPHRQEIAPNTVNMPNMSRSSLGKHASRVAAMISRSPEQASYIRERYAARTVPKPRLEYDSGDDTDLTELSKYEKNNYNSYVQHNYQETRIRRVYRAITTIITTIFTSIASVVPTRKRQPEYLYYTRIERESWLQRSAKAIANAWLSVLKRFYIVISTILTIDTWLLMSRSSKLMGERKRKFLMIWMFLLPLLLLGGYLYHNDNEAHSIPAVLRQSKDRLVANVANAYSDSLDLGKRYYSVSETKMLEALAASKLSLNAISQAVVEMYENSRNFSVEYAAKARESIEPYLLTK